MVTELLEYGSLNIGLGFPFELCGYFGVKAGLLSCDFVGSDFTRLESAL